MTLSVLRAASGILLAALLFAAGNYFGDWGFFGGAGKALWPGCYGKALWPGCYSQYSSFLPSCRLQTSS